MSVFVAMLAAALGLATMLVAPYVSFALAFVVLFPIAFVVRKVAPWDDDDDFHPRKLFFAQAAYGLACAICVSGPLVYAGYLTSDSLPRWPLVVIPGAVTFVAAFFGAMVAYFPVFLAAAALFGIPAAGVAAYFWG